MMLQLTQYSDGDLRLHTNEYEVPGSYEEFWKFFMEVERPNISMDHVRIVDMTNDISFELRFNKSLYIILDDTELDYMEALMKHVRVLTKLDELGTHFPIVHYDKYKADEIIIAHYGALSYLWEFDHLIMSHKLNKSDKLAIIRNLTRFADFKLDLDIKEAREDHIALVQMYHSK